MSFPDGYRYVCTFLDHFSGYTLLEFLKHHSDLQDAFDALSSEFQKVTRGEFNFQYSTKIQGIHSDGAPKYKALISDDGSHELIKIFCPPYNPYPNAIAEGKSDDG